MKNHEAYQNNLVAYLQGELNSTDAAEVRTHLEACADCRAELEVHRATLALLGDALAAASTPRELAPWDLVPKPKEGLAGLWFHPSFRAALASAAVFSALFFISLNVVVFSALKKEVARGHEEIDVSFVAPTEAEADRPKMRLKKSRMLARKSAPKPSNRIITTRNRARLPEIELPWVGEVGYGLAGGGGLMESDSVGAIGFSMPNAEGFNTEGYDLIVENSFKTATRDPLSTFSIDVDRAAYANVRRFLNDNQLPPPDAVRVEEMVNYFNYDYPRPRGEDPFVVSMELAECPWNAKHRLALIGLKGLEIETEDLPPNNLVFLLDVSGSMESPDKLPLLQSAMRLLVDQLRPQDQVSVVVYAGAAGLVLEPTNNKDKILAAIDRLEAGGSTAGGEGIKLAYKIALDAFIKDGNNRVILATDGDFNVGVSSDAELVRLIEKKRNDDIFLTVLGFGSGNLKDSKMEKLADRGNGNYAYIDDILEAKKTLVNEMGGTLVTIAKDVKIQIEFNPRQVKGYRLIGYENRVLAAEEFDDDQKDAGELGAGHAVTALYELIMADSNEVIPTAGELKYQRTKFIDSDELMTVKLRYKQPHDDVSKLIIESIKAAETNALRPNSNIGFASAVAEFGMLLRGSEYTGDASYDDVIERAKAFRGEDMEGYRAEFIRMVEKAQMLEKSK